MSVQIKEYNRNDMKKFPKEDYPWEENYGTIWKDIKTKIRNFLLNNKYQRFIAYDEDENIICGTIYVEEITKNTSYLGGTYVSPKARRRGIGSMLRNYCISYLSKHNYKYMVGIISSKNIPSIISGKKVYGGFLPQLSIEFNINLMDLKHISCKNKMEKIDNKNHLFVIHNKCMSKEWYNVLDVNSHNYLERHIRNIYGKGLIKYFISKKIITNKYNSNIYSCIRSIFLDKNNIYAYTVFSDDLSIDDIYEHIKMIVQYSYNMNYKKLHLNYTNKNSELSNKLAIHLCNNFKCSFERMLIHYTKL